MMHAYDKDVMLSARERFAVMLDYAVSYCKIPLRAFYDRFLGSGIAPLLEDGYPKYALGMSGIELSVKVMENTGGTLPVKEDYCFPEGDSSVYWTGWALCQYQWYKAQSFASIDRGGLPIEKIHGLFSPLHEADITKVVEVFDRYFKPRIPGLKEGRKRAGLTQQTLSERSGVSLRMIRAYEQGTQDLSRAGAATVLQLARVLHCSPQVLLY